MSPTRNSSSVTRISMEQFEKQLSSTAGDNDYSGVQMDFPDSAIHHDHNDKHDGTRITIDEDADQQITFSLNEPLSSVTPPQLIIQQSSSSSTQLSLNYPIRRSVNRGFIQRRCNSLISFFKWLPVIFISAVLGWGFYAYTIQLCFYTISSVMEKSLFLLLFLFLYVMTFWSYGKTIFTKNAKIPKEFWLTIGDIQALNSCQSEEERKVLTEKMARERNIWIEQRTFTGCLRICEKCSILKPDRAHHCSVCDSCILKMDHHCPWVNNCVSYSNYKYFVLFLGYSFALCFWSAATSFPYFLRFWKSDLGTNGSGSTFSNGYSKLHILFLFFVSIMFSISLLSLFLYHIYLTLKNRSTLESFRTPIFLSGPDKNAYNLGKEKNFEEIFGENKILWFFPVQQNNSGGMNDLGSNGLRYERRTGSRDINTSHTSYDQRRKSSDTFDV